MQYYRWSGWEGTNGSGCRSSLNQESGRKPNAVQWRCTRSCLLGWRMRCSSSSTSSSSQISSYRWLSFWNEILAINNSNYSPGNENFDCNRCTQKYRGIFEESLAESRSIQKDPQPANNFSIWTAAQFVRTWNYLWKKDTENNINTFWTWLWCIRIATHPASPPLPKNLEIISRLRIGCWHLFK